MDYAREPLFPLADEIAPLLQRHYDEIALHQDTVKLDPDWAKYATLDEAGMLRIYTARNDGVLVGYAVFLVSPHLHYRQTILASNDIVYLAPEYRGHRDGLGLIVFCEQQLKQAGANKIVWHIKHHMDWSPALLAMGYSDEEKIVGKIL